MAETTNFNLSIQGGNMNILIVALFILSICFKVFYGKEISNEIKLFKRRKH